MAVTYTHRHAIEAFKHVAIDQSGYPVDELPWSDLYIVRKIQEVRSTAIKAALKAGEGISELMVQTLPCVNVTELDRNECPCVPASGCYWLKTDCAIPRYCKMISVTGIVANGENPRFTFIKWDRFQYIPKSRSKSVREGLYWTIKDTGEDGPYVYLYGNRNLEIIAISGIWEDPMCVEALPKCGKEKRLEPLCNPFDVDFYTDAWLRDRILDIVWQKLIPVRSAATQDVQNDDLFGNNPLQTQT
jgi:hypothetical protein